MAEKILMDKLFSKKITFFSFVYSLLMICFHANADVHFKNIIKSEQFLGNIAWIINSALTKSGGTYFFIMLSAFLLYYNLTENNAKEKLVRRIRTLLIPWLLWNVIGLLSYYHDLNKGLAHVITYFLTSRYCEALWFVQMLIIMLFFMPFIKKILKIKIVSEIFLIIIFVISYYNWPFIRDINIFPSERFKNEIFRMLAHVPMYCFGAYLGLNWSEIILGELYNKHKVLVKAGALILLVLPFMQKNTFIGYALGMLQSLFIWLLIDKKIFNFKMPWWMQISFYTYAIHNFVLYWEGKLLKLSGVFSDKFNGSAVSIEFALTWRMALSGVAFLLIVISAYILIKFMPKLYEVLSGGRVPRKSL